MDTTPFHTSGSKPQESLVVQVYGISRPSQEFKDRLNGTIQHKLEAAALDVMCSVYARNQLLKLTPEDVDFLQPDRKPSHTLHLSLPAWLQQEYTHPFFFYFLQTLSTFAVHPTYPGGQSKQLLAHQELQYAYLVETYSHQGHKDHLFLYIRPPNKGRGMGVVCVSLADINGSVQAPLPTVTRPMCAAGSGGVAGLEEERLEGVLSEEVRDGCASIRVHMWEKGNIGLEEFMLKLGKCFTHTVLDYYLEISLLPCPIAKCISKWEELGIDKDMLISVGETTPTPTGGCGPKDSPLYSGAQSPSKEVKTETPRKKVSVVSNKSSSSSRHSSDSASRRGSAQGSESRRASAQGSESKRASAQGSESRRASTQGSESRRGSSLASDSRRGSSQVQGSESRRDSGMSESSRKSSLASERRRSSAERGGRNEELWYHKFSDDVIEEAEEFRSMSTTSSLDLQASLELALPTAGRKQEEEESLWLQKEKLRRMQEAMDVQMREAELGTCGRLNEVFSSALPRHLSLAHSREAPSVKYTSFPLLGHYSTRAFISQVLGILDSASAHTSSDVFQLTPGGYLHVLADRDWTKVQRKVLRQLYSTEFILLNRSTVQWEECCYGNGGKEHSTPPQQLFLPLDSSKLSHTHSSPAPPLLTIAEARTAFIPRRMLIFIQASQQKVKYCCSIAYVFCVVL